MITSGVIAVGTAAVAISTPCFNPSRIIVQNNDNTDAVLIGGSAVGTANGLTVTKLERLDITLNPGEQLYVISTKTGHSVSFLHQRC